MQTQQRQSKGAVTRERMLRAALGLIQSRGLTGAGMTQILEAADAPRGSLYFHFPGGKEELAREAVELASRDIAAMIAASIAAHESVADAAAAVIDELAAALEESDFAVGCPVAAVTLDAASSSPVLQESCGAAYGSWQRLLADRLEADGEDRASADTKSLALLGLIEGATVVSRAQRSVAPLRAASATVGALLGATR